MQFWGCILYTHIYTGDDGGEVTPVTIPNTEVKLICAYDTWTETSWKNGCCRLYQKSQVKAWLFCFFFGFKYHTFLNKKTTYRCRWLLLRFCFLYLVKYVQNIVLCYLSILIFPIIGSSLAKPLAAFTIPRIANTKNITPNKFEIIARK